jgi:hypothetical protein
MSKRETTRQTSPRLIAAKRAAEGLGLPYTTLLDVARRGELPIVRVARAIYFESRDIDHWVETRKTQG